MATPDGEPVYALDYVIVSIRYYYYDSGSFFLLRQALAACTLLLSRLGHFRTGRHRQWIAAKAYTLSIVPGMNVVAAHLRDAMGDQTYVSLAHSGETMTTAVMVAYAYDQIDHARTELNAFSK